MSAGRPSEYSQEIADEICDRIASGESLISICKDPRMPYERAVFRWLRKEEHADFCQDYARAREDQAHYIHDENREIARHATPETVQVAKLQIEDNRWRAGRMHPKVYGDKTAVEHSGKIQTEEVGLSIEERLAKSPAAREALRKKLAEADENAQEG